MTQGARRDISFFPFLPLSSFPTLQPTYRTLKCTSENNQVSTGKQHRSLALISGDTEYTAP